MSKSFQLLLCNYIIFAFVSVKCAMLFSTFSVLVHCHFCWGVENSALNFNCQGNFVCGKFIWKFVVLYYCLSFLEIKVTMSNNPNNSLS